MWRVCQEGSDQPRRGLGSELGRRDGSPETADSIRYEVTGECSENQNDMWDCGENDMRDCGEAHDISEY